MRFNTKLSISLALFQNGFSSLSVRITHSETEGQNSASGTETEIVRWRTSAYSNKSYSFASLNGSKKLLSKKYEND